MNLFGYCKAYLGDNQAIKDEWCRFTIFKTVVLKYEIENTKEGVKISIYKIVKY
jgi:hypothetical protein